MEIANKDIFVFEKLDDEDEISEDEISEDEISEDADDAEEYPIEKIIENKKEGRKHMFLVKWEGFRNPSWEPLKCVKETSVYQNYKQVSAFHSETRK